MNSVSPRRCSDIRGQGGFTLLELVIAMSFVALLASGIVISISTCLNVWERSRESADLNQEARAIIETISRDLRGAYLGLYRHVGFFIGNPARQGASPFDVVELSTEGSISRVALLPDDFRSAGQELRSPESDYIGVRYQWHRAFGSAPAGLYRISWVVPTTAAPRLQLASEPQSYELISQAVTRLQLRYLDGHQWLAAYNARDRENRPPTAVLLELTLQDASQHEYDFRTMVPIASRW